MPLRDAVRMFALLGGSSAPDNFQIHDVEISAGESGKLDHATFEFDLGHRRIQKLVEDLTFSDLGIPTTNGNLKINGAACNIVGFVGNQTRHYHWGTVSVCEPEVGQAETLRFVSRILPTHFGQPLGFQKVWRPQSRTFGYLEHDVIFNPEIEHHVRGNMRVPVSAAGTTEYPIFCDFHSTRTPTACRFQGVQNQPLTDAARQAEEAPEYWSLVDAVRYLCGECNPAQQFLRNPTTAALRSVLNLAGGEITAADRGIIKNHHIRRGLYLNEALQALLEPYGFTFAIDYASPTSRFIRIYKKGVGPQKQIRHQARGENVESSKTEADQVALSYDVSQAVNQITSAGYFTQCEATFELMPGWDPSYDGLEIADLIKDGPDWLDHPERHTVQRLWVLGEDGSYARAWGTRPANSAYDLTPIFRSVYGADHAEVPTRRRRFLPMLTLGDDRKPLGKVGGCHVTWWNPDKDGGAGWDELKSDYPFFACRLLEGQCGILFTGQLPPIFIMDAGAAARVRITATVESDYRIQYQAVRPASSVNPQVHEVFLDLNKRFHFRALHADSEFYSDVQAGERLADLSDGRASIRSFTEALRGNWDQADLSGSITLEGVDRTNLKLGDLVTGIDGRKLNFALNKQVGTGAKYAQIVGLRYHAQAQTTTVILGSFRETDAWLGGLLRKTRRLR